MTDVATENKELNVDCTGCAPAASSELIDNGAAEHECVGGVDGGEWGIKGGYLLVRIAAFLVPIERRPYCDRSKRVLEYM